MSISGPEGFLLLTIPNCTLRTPSVPSQTGHLALQCITLDIPSETPLERDVWLVLKLNTFEIIISPTQQINYSRSAHTYMFLPETSAAEPIELVAPPDPHNPASCEDLETMEVILSQYGVVHDIEGPSFVRDTDSKGRQPVATANSDSEFGVVQPSRGTSDFKGRLILMDEENGQVMATLDEAVAIKEDKSLREGHDKEPVVVDLPSEEEERTGRSEAHVHIASPEERDMLMQTAGLISRGIVFATSVISSGMTSVSKYYIGHSTPNPKPVEFSPRTRANMKRIHSISGTAVTVTAKTTSAILGTLDHVVDKVAGSNSKGSQGTPAAVPIPAKKPRLLNRLLASTDLLLTTIESSAKELIETGTEAVSASMGHRYGQEARDVSKMAGQSVRNVGLVYVDVKGVGRRALLKRAGKAVVKARMGGQEVAIGPPAHAMEGSRPHSFPSPTLQSSSSLLNRSSQATGSGTYIAGEFKK